MGSAYHRREGSAYPPKHLERHGRIRLHLLPTLDWDEAVEGWFWLPAATPRKVRGVLTTSWTEGAELSLERHLFAGQAIHDRIYGVDMAGRPLVLLNAFTRQQIHSTSEPERFRHVLAVNRVLLGTHRPKTRFPRATVWFGALSDFMTDTAISVTPGPPPRATWEPPTRQIIRVADLAIQFKHAIDFSGGYRGVRMRDDLRVEFRARRGREALDWQKAIDVIDVFVGFCTMQPAAFERISLFDHRNGEVEYRYRLRSFSGPESGRPWLRQDSFGSYLGMALENWYAYRDSSPEAFFMIAEYVAFGGNLNWADRLLLLARFLEVHHRRSRKGGLLPKATHKARMKAIVSSAPSEHRAWLEKALASSNSLSLYERLNEIGASLGNGLTPMLGGDLQKFSRRVTETRNYYTHYSSSLKAKAAQEWDLVILAKRLWFVVRGCVLVELGFSPKQAIEALQLDADWDWLRRQPPS